MRMRKKKNIVPRMEAVKSYLLESAADIPLDENIYLEVGCGKGTFICTMAKRHPERQFVAVEKVESVILLAMEKAKAQEISNLRFFKGDVMELANLEREHFCDRIFLNFSDPWPRGRHAKRRLTADSFLSLYKKLLSEDGDIHMKTDNTELFDFSLETFPQNGFELDKVTRDLHKNPPHDNIMTEYEQNFVSQGKPICRLEAKIKAEKNK